jgi:hypothetical protein
VKELKIFLINHPLISISGIEKECHIPSGTLRLTGNRSIPKKYITSIEQLLMNYGYKNNVLIDEVKSRLIDTINLITDNS